MPAVGPHPSPSSAAPARGDVGPFGVLWQRVGDPRAPGARG